MSAVRAIVGVLVALVLAGCQLTAELNVVVEPDGSGTVEIGIGLDDDALERRPDVFDELDVDDLVEAGWVFTGPVREGDRTWLRASRDFASPDELGPLIDDVAGTDGPFRDFSLTRESAFAETIYAFRGTVDFAGGLDEITDDPELAEALDAEPVELLEERLGAAIDRLISVQVAVRLPGEVESNATTRASNGAVWSPSVLEEEAIELVATSTVSRSERLVWVAVAVAAGIALVLVLAIRLASWRRSRRVTDS